MHYKNERGLRTKRLVLRISAAIARGNLLYISETTARRNLLDILKTWPGYRLFDIELMSTECLIGFLLAFNFLWTSHCEAVAWVSIPPFDRHQLGWISTKYVNARKNVHTVYINFTKII